jgi:hypothetical protein
LARRRYSDAIANEAQAGAQAEALDADLERNTMALQLLASAQRNPSLLFNVKVWLVGNLRFHQTVPDSLERKTHCSAKTF